MFRLLESMSPWKVARKICRYNNRLLCITSDDTRVTDFGKNQFNETILLMYYFTCKFRTLKYILKLSEISDWIWRFFFLLVTYGGRLSLVKWSGHVPCLTNSSKVQTEKKIRSYPPTISLSFRLLKNFLPFSQKVPNVFFPSLLLFSKEYTGLEFWNSSGFLSWR